MSTFFKSVLLLLVAALAGCDSDLSLEEVEGVVTLGGEPLPNAVVTFSPKGDGPSAVGKTDAQGHYQLLTSAKPGAIAGEHTVSIIAVPEPAPVVAVPSDDPSYKYGGSTSSANFKPQPVPKVPPRYNSRTELTEQVKPGANTINFDLES